MTRLLRIVPLVLATVLYGSGLHAAGIAEQSERLFATMTNATAPSAHLGQRRGVFDGGSLQSRNRIAAESLWHIVPPSFEAGCGGIDLYAGSFSFINAEQFQALLRAIAANAAGYAFQLAVNAMSREAGELMSKLQDTLQKLNQGFADSCQLAQGLVNDTVSAFQGTLTAKTSQTLATTGIGDIFETWTASTGQGPATQARTNLSDAQRSQADLQGNIVWQALKRSNVAARFVGGDDRLLEAIMSVTGSLIVGPAEAAPDGEGESARITPLRGNVLSVRDLLWGPRSHERDPGRRTTQFVQRYDCVDRDADACLAPQIVGEDDLVGLAQHTERMLLGDPSNAANVGLVEKFRWGNLAFTEAEKAFMELAPHGVGAMLRNLGQHDSGTARAFAEQASPIIALEMTKLLIDDLIRQVEGAVALHDSPYAKQAIEQIRAAKEDVAQEYTELAQRHGNLQSLMQYYGNLAVLLKGRSMLSGVPESGTDSAPLRLAMWEIFSIGDAAYLTAVLNAVAMLSGAGDMRTLAGIGFLVGLLLVMFQGIVQARPPQFQHLLVAWVIYLGMFGPTVRVSVEDVYSGAVRVVDNVPLGPAAIGSAMSQIGFGVARLFEEAFSTPAMTEYGFAAPLHILQGVRKTTLSMTALGAANAPTAGADMAKTFVNYLSECTLYGYNNGTRSAGDILRNPNWADALGSSLVVPTTQLWIGGNPVTKECPEAWGDLSAYLVAQYEPALRRSVAATLGIENPDDVPGAVNAALDAIAGAGVGAQNYMVMATAAAFLPYAEAKNKRDLLQYQDAVAIEQAAQQRNTQWASEERLFARIVRPMMTFFEAFLFAVSPLMVFAIGLGPVGIRMVGKYLLFGLWIQLWQPILAIVNLYLLMAIRFKMDALQDAALGNTPLPSIEAIWKLDFLLSDYLGVGGMLAASTPAISLMLIYGSAITATHLAGRLQSGDYINEKIASPDVASPAAALTVGPIQDHGPIRGTAAPGAESVTWTANVGQEVQRDLRSSEQAMERSSQGFASALSSAASLTASRSGESFENHASTWMKEGAKSATDQVLWQTAEGLTRQYSQSGLSTNQMAAILAGGLGGSAGFRGSSLERQEAARADISSRLQSQYGVQSELADGMSTDIARRVTSNVGLETRISEAIKVDSQAGDRNVFTSGLSGEESSRLTQSSEDVLSASRSLDRAESRAERFGTLGSYNGIPTGAALVRPENHAQIERLEQQIARYNLDGDVQYESHRLLAGGVTADPEQARAMAGMGLLLGHADGERVRGMTAGEQASAKEAGMEILSGLFNFRAPDGIAPDLNAGLSGTVPGFGGTRPAVEASGLQDVLPSVQGLPDQVEAHARGVQDTWSPAPLERFAQGAGRDLSAFRADRQNAIHQEQQAKLGAIIREHAALPRTAAQLAHHEIGGAFAMLAESGALTQAGAAGVAGQVTAGAKAFTQSLLDGKGLGAAMQCGRAAAGSEQGWTAAREALIDARMSQVEGFGLTPTQENLYRQATESVLAFAPSAAQQVARQSVIDEAGPQTGAQIAELIERSASSKDDSDLRLIGAYNRTAVEEKKSHEPRLGELGDMGQPLMAPAHLSGHFGALERAYGLPNGLLTAIAYVESTFNVGAVSPAGAQGMFQIMPKTAAELGIANPFDPVEAAEGAAMHLARDFRTFRNWEHAVIAYNAGPHRIREYLAGSGSPLKQETLDYLPKVEAALQRVNATP